MITENEIKRMALLSKLEINDDEMPEYLKELEDLIEHIRAVDTLADDSSYSLRGVEDFNSLREDRVGVSLEREEVLFNSEGAGDGFVKLRKRA